MLESKKKLKKYFGINCLTLTILKMSTKNDTYRNIESFSKYYSYIFNFGYGSNFIRTDRGSGSEKLV